MKHCLRCQRRYDDSWGICLSCATALTANAKHYHEMSNDEKVQFLLERLHAIEEEVKKAATKAGANSFNPFLNYGMKFLGTKLMEELEFLVKLESRLDVTFSKVYYRTLWGLMFPWNSPYYKSGKFQYEFARDGICEKIAEINNKLKALR